MEPSRGKLSAAVLLLLPVFVMAAGPVQAGECLKRGTKYRWPCVNSDRCAEACMNEGKGYSGGKCGGLFLFCFCIRPCEATA